MENIFGENENRPGGFNLVWFGKSFMYFLHITYITRMSIYTVNKGLAISCPQPGCHLPNSPWPGIIYLVPVPGRCGQ